jgi:threonine/homoserine/homoserine lactone efflux protein
LLISVGHGIVEMPLICLLMLGLGLVFELDPVKIAIGLLGGGFLLWMGTDILRHRPINADTPETVFSKGSLTTGIVLSATNPYFLLWWATVGLNLAVGASELGTTALILFAIVHWLCDVVWLAVDSVVQCVLHPQRRRLIQQPHPESYPRMLRHRPADFRRQVYLGRSKVMADLIGPLLRPAGLLPQFHLLGVLQPC